MGTHPLRACTGRAPESPPRRVPARVRVCRSPLPFAGRACGTDAQVCGICKRMAPPSAQAHASMRANPRLLHHGLPHPGRIGCDFVKILRIEGRTPTRQIQLGRQKNFGVDKVGVARPAGCTGRREKQGEARFRTRSREGGLGPVTRPSRDDRSASAGGSAPSALPKCDAGRRNG